MNIQSVALLAARDLDESAMVIKYVGELIRDEVANRREGIYDVVVSSRNWWLSNAVIRDLLVRA